MTTLTEKKDFYYDEDYNLCVLTGASSNFEKTYESKIQNLKSWLNSPDCLDRFNEHKWNLLWNLMRVEVLVNGKWTH